MPFAMLLVRRHPQIGAMNPYQVVSIRLSPDQTHSYYVLSDGTFVKTHDEPGNAADYVRRAAAGEKGIIIDHEPE